MAGVDGEVVVGGASDGAGDKRRGTPLTPLILVAVVTGVLLAFCIGYVFWATTGYRASQVPLYGAEEVTYTVSPANQFVTMTIKLCLDDQEAQTTLAAMGFSDGTAEYPGSASVFVSDPGCHEYTFAGIAFPPAFLDDVECIERSWTIHGALSSLQQHRPPEIFSVDVKCL